MQAIYRAVYSRGFAAAALVVSLVALLLAGLHNVAKGFADVKLGASPLIHWGGAVAVELGVVAIGLVIAVRSREGDRNVRLYLGILLFVAASVFANYDASLGSLIHGQITWGKIIQQDRWTLLKAALLGGAIPLMVLFVIEALRELGTGEEKDPGEGKTSPPPTDRKRSQSEPDLLIVGTVAGDAEAGAAAAERGNHAGRPVSRSVSRVVSSRVSPARHRETGRETGSKEKMRQLVRRDPTVSPSDLARHLGVGRATVYRWRDELGLERVDGEWVVAA